MWTSNLNNPIKEVKFQNSTCRFFFKIRRQALNWYRKKYQLVQRASRKSGMSLYWASYKLWDMKILHLPHKLVTKVKHIVLRQLHIRKHGIKIKTSLNQALQQCSQLHGTKARIRAFQCVLEALLWKVTFIFCCWKLGLWLRTTLIQMWKIHKNKVLRGHFTRNREG